MEEQEYRPEREEKKIVDLLDKYVSSPSNTTRDAFIHEICNLTPKQLSATANRLEKNEGTKVDRANKNEVVALTFNYADADFFFQTNTCGDKHLLNGDTIEENDTTRITRSFNGEHMKFEKTADGQFKGFTAHYDVQRNENGEFKSCRVTSIYPDGVLEVSEVMQDDYEAIRLARDTQVKFVTLDGNPHNFFLQLGYR